MSSPYLWAARLYPLIAFLIEEITELNREKVCISRFLSSFALHGTKNVGVHTSKLTLDSHFLSLSFAKNSSISATWNSYSVGARSLHPKDCNLNTAIMN